MVTASRPCSLVFILLASLIERTAAQGDEDYKIPALEFKAFSPMGFRAALPDSKGVQFFAFHASVNTPIEGPERGAISEEIRKKQRLENKKTYWIFRDKCTELQPGDKVYYWYWVQYKGVRHVKLANVWIVDLLFDRNTSVPVMAATDSSYVVDPASITCLGCLPLTILTKQRKPGESGSSGCHESVTMVNGLPACEGSLVFEDDFEQLDLRTWQHEVTLSGGRDMEFHLYDNNRTNSYVKYGNLFIKPTVTSDRSVSLLDGELSLDSGAPEGRCTNYYNNGCYKRAFGASILNPVQSARIRTHNSFSFRYGKVEVRAKMPSGDWIHPGIWLAPRFNNYGSWPASGIMMLAEARGNKELRSINGESIGVNYRVDQGLQFAPFRMPSRNLSSTTLLPGFFKAIHRFPEVHGQGYGEKFHRYQMEWRPDYVKFSVDDREVGRVTPSEKPRGMWHFANFKERIPGAENPWKYGTKIAPFDQEFYISIGVAVGGVHYFPDDAINQPEKPWNNTSPHAAYDFWRKTEMWYRSWWPMISNGENAALEVDYVRVWAL